MKSHISSFGIILASLLAIAFLSRPIDNPSSAHWIGRDHYQYFKMAANPSFIHHNSGKIPAPYCYRVLIPYIIWLLHADIARAFYCINFTVLFLMGIFMYLFFHEHGVRREIATAGVVLVNLGIFVRNSLTSYYITDAFNLLIIVLGMLLILKKKDALLSLIIGIGVTNKEIAVILIPYYFMTLLQRGNITIRKAIVRSMAVTIFPVAVYISIHAAVKPSGRRFNEIQYILMQFHTSVDYRKVLLEKLAQILRTWGVFLIICAAPMRDIVSYFTRRRQDAVFIIAVSFIFLAGSDYERCVFIVSPAFLLFCLLNYERLIKKGIFSKWRTSIFLSIFQYLFYITDFRDTFILPVNYRAFKTIMAIMLVSMSFYYLIKENSYRAQINAYSYHL